MDESHLGGLPFELIEAICDAPESLIEKHHVRSLLRACCVALSGLRPASKQKYSKYTRAITWLHCGATIDFILERKLCTKKKIMSLIAASGRLDLLRKYAGIYPWTYSTCASAAANGHLDCLRFCHESGCDWNGNTLVNAAKSGHIDCLQYAHENSCPITIVDDRIYSYQNVGPERVCIAAAGGGQLDCLRFAHDSGYIWSYRTCAAAAANGHLNCLRYAHANNCSWVDPGLTWLRGRDGYHNVCYKAAESGHLDCLLYAHENGCYWKSLVCEIAAENGHIDCLRYAHENGCGWDERVCEAAASAGNLECLKYAHENGCAWDWYTTDAAAKGQLHCLIYLYENGCPIRENICDCVSARGLSHERLHCLMYANRNGYQISEKHLAAAMRFYRHDCAICIAQCSAKLLKY